MEPWQWRQLFDKGENNFDDQAMRRPVRIFLPSMGIFLEMIDFNIGTGEGEPYLVAQEAK